MSIPFRKLGKNGPAVSAIGRWPASLPARLFYTANIIAGYGSMGLSIAYGPAPQDSERHSILTHSVTLGSTHIDTASIYGDSETLIGSWLAVNPDLRPQIFLATKFGSFLGAGGFRGRGDAAFVRECIDESFRRLRVDVIDLIYVHRIDSTIPIEETIAAVKEYVDAGRIRYIGLSEASADTIRRAHAVHTITAVQFEYSPFALEIEDPAIGVLSTCRELGIAIVAYSPLGRGLLTGTFKSPNDFAANDSRRHMFVCSHLRKHTCISLY